MRLLLYVTTMLFSIIVTGERAYSGDNSWRFGAKESQIASRRQEIFGQRLLRPLKARVCFEGQTEFIASFQGKEFLAPCRFIHETMRHLREALESTRTMEPISLDTNHAHLAVPEELWEAQYSKLPRDKILAELLPERALVAIYHTAEPLTETDGQTKGSTPAEKRRKEKRHVLGFFDGRANGILPYQTRGSSFTLPAQYRSAAWLFFRPHRSGELVVSAGDVFVAFDLSFDSDLADSDTWQEDLVRFDDSAK